MVTSDVEIANQAISHLGVGNEIANLTTDQTERAQAIRAFFSTVRESVLREFPWDFATKIVTLNEIEQNPTDEWARSYRYPTDCVFIRRILSGLRNDNTDSKIPYRIFRDDDGLLIYTDEDDADMEYTMREENPSRYPPDFVVALSYLLAFKVAPRLTGGDPFQLGNRAMQLYRFTIQEAQKTAAREVEPDLPPDSEFIRAR